MHSTRCHDAFFTQIDALENGQDTLWPLETRSLPRVFGLRSSGLGLGLTLRVPFGQSMYKISRCALHARYSEHASEEGGGRQYLHHRAREGETEVNTEQLSELRK